MATFFPAVFSSKGVLPFFSITVMAFFVVALSVLFLLFSGMSLVFLAGESCEGRSAVFLFRGSFLSVLP